MFVHVGDARCSLGGVATRGAKVKCEREREWRLHCRLYICFPTIFNFAVVRRVNMSGDRK